MNWGTGMEQKQMRKALMQAVHDFQRLFVGSLAFPQGQLPAAGPDRFPRSGQLRLDLQHGIGHGVRGIFFKNVQPGHGFSADLHFKRIVRPANAAVELSVSKMVGGHAVLRAVGNCDPQIGELLPVRVRRQKHHRKPIQTCS